MADTKPNVRLQRRDNLVEVIHTQTHEVLAWCFIGDDDNVERIADILSAKRLGWAAQELREMARQDRFQAMRKPPQKVDLADAARDENAWRCDRCRRAGAVWWDRGWLCRLCRALAELDWKEETRAH
jgi:hypothetical protein